MLHNHPRSGLLYHRSGLSGLTPLAVHITHSHTCHALLAHHQNPREGDSTAQLCAKPKWLLPTACQLQGRCITWAWCGLLCKAVLCHILCNVSQTAVCLTVESIHRPSGHQALTQMSTRASVPSPYMVQPTQPQPHDQRHGNDHQCPLHLTGNAPGQSGLCGPQGMTGRHICRI